MDKDTVKSERKRMLIFNDFLTGGGVEKLMYDFVWHWHTIYDITVLTEHYGAGAEEILPPDVKYLHLRLAEEHRDTLSQKVVNKLRKIRHKKALDKQIRGNEDILICMKDGWTMKNALDYREIPKRFAWIHTDYSSYYYTGPIFGGPEAERAAMQSFDRVVCVADRIAESIREVIGDPGNLVTRYNPIHVDEIRKAALEPVVDVPTEKEEGVTRFVTVGRLNFQKGYDLLLEACHILESEGRKFEVWIVGGEESWSEEQYRLYRAKERMHVDSVKFIGGRQNPYKYMAHADWFLSTSIFEGYSLVSQEAAALGVPLLLTDCSGVRELLGDEEYGVIMEISVLGICRGMRRVMDSPVLHEHYKQKIIERSSSITFEGRMKEIDTLLE